MKIAEVDYMFREVALLLIGTLVFILVLYLLSKGSKKNARPLKYIVVAGLAYLAVSAFRMLFSA